jgi:hypothetical protein
MVGTGIPPSAPERGAQVKLTASLPYSTTRRCLYPAKGWHRLGDEGKAAEDSTPWRLCCLSFRKNKSVILCSPSQAAGRASHSSAPAVDRPPRGCAKTKAPTLSPSGLFFCDTGRRFKNSKSHSRPETRVGSRRYDCPSVRHPHLLRRSVGCRPATRTMP